MTGNHALKKYMVNQMQTKPNNEKPEANQLQINLNDGPDKN